MFFVILTQKTYFDIAQDYNLRLMLESWGQARWFTSLEYEWEAAPTSVGLGFPLALFIHLYTIEPLSHHVPDQLSCKYPLRRSRDASSARRSGRGSCGLRSPLSRPRFAPTRPSRCRTDSEQPAHEGGKVITNDRPHNVRVNPVIALLCSLSYTTRKPSPD